MNFLDSDLITEADRIKYYNFEIKDTKIISGDKISRISPTIQCRNKDLKKIRNKERREIIKNGLKYLDEINLRIDWEQEVYICALVGIGLKYRTAKPYTENILSWVMDIVWIDDVVVDFINLFPIHTYWNIINPKEYDRYIMLVKQKIIDTYIRFNYFEEEFDEIIFDFFSIFF